MDVSFFALLDDLLHSFFIQFKINQTVFLYNCSFLGDLHFANGNPVYNERELSHMVDVKKAVQATLNVWYASLLGLLALGIAAWRGGWLVQYRAALSRGGWLTAILVSAIILLTLFAFGMFFVAFHNLFFQAGTWTFEFSDTLIRVTPERFWRDVFIYIGSIALGAGLALGYGLRSRSQSPNR